MLGGLDLFFHLKSFSRVYYINDSTRPRSLEVFEECPRMPAVGIGRIDTLRRKIVQLLEIRIPEKLLVNSGVSKRARFGTRITISFS